MLEFHFKLSSFILRDICFALFSLYNTHVSRLERIMDMINVLCLDDGRLNYSYIRDRYGISNREFRRDIDFIRERLTDIGYMDKLSSVEYIRKENKKYYVFSGDKPRLNEAFVNSTIADAISRAQHNTLKEQFEGLDYKNSDEIVPVRYMYNALEKVNYSVFSHLVSAIKERRVVNIKYVNSRGLESTHPINPMELINYSQIWYLRAETQYGNIRTYSLSRILEITNTEKHFVYDAGKLKENEGSYGIFSNSEEPVWYTMRFYSVAANIVSNQIWHKEQKGVWIDKNTYELSVPAVSDIEIMGKMLSFAPDSRPVAPEAFVSRYERIIDKCASGKEKKQ